MQMLSPKPQHVAPPPAPVYQPQPAPQYSTNQQNQPGQTNYNQWGQGQMPSNDNLTENDLPFPIL